MVRTGGARIEHAAKSLSIQLLADGLELRPASPTRTGSGKAELRQLGGRGQVGDVAHSDSPPPQITGHLMGRRKPNLGEHPIPLCPSRLLLIGKVDRRQVAAHLPAATRRRRRQPQRVPAVRSLPPPRTRWERRSHLAPLRRPELAPRPSDLRSTVRCSWSSSGRRRKEWDHEWRRSSRSGETGIGRACRSGRWLSATVFIDGRYAKRSSRRCLPSRASREVVLHRSWGRIKS